MDTHVKSKDIPKSDFMNDMYHIISPIIKEARDFWNPPGSAKKQKRQFDAPSNTQDALDSYYRKNPNKIRVVP